MIRRRHGDWWTYSAEDCTVFFSLRLSVLWSATVDRWPDCNFLARLLFKDTYRHDYSIVFYRCLYSYYYFAQYKFTYLLTVSPVWHSSLTVAQTESLESLQKRAMRIFFPHLDYSGSLFIAEAETLE